MLDEASNYIDELFKMLADHRKIEFVLFHINAFLLGFASTLENHVIEVLLTLQN